MAQGSEDDARIVNESNSGDSHNGPSHAREGSNTDGSSTNPGVIAGRHKKRDSASSSADPTESSRSPEFELGPSPFADSDELSRVRQFLDHREPRVVSARGTESEPNTSVGKWSTTTIPVVQPTVSTPIIEFSPNESSDSDSEATHSHISAESVGNQEIARPPLPAGGRRRRQVRLAQVAASRKIKWSAAIGGAIFIVAIIAVLIATMMPEPAGSNLYQTAAPSTSEGESKTTDPEPSQGLEPAPDDSASVDSPGENPAVEGEGVFPELSALGTRDGVDVMLTVVLVSGEDAIEGIEITAAWPDGTVGSCITEATGRCRITVTTTQDEVSTASISSPLGRGYAAVSVSLEL